MNNNKSTDSKIPANAVKTILKSQYRASLAMLRQVVELCPNDLWFDESPENQFWHIAFHTVFYTHFYAQVTDKAFQSWEKHRKDYEFLSEIPWSPGEKPSITDPYTKTDISEYVDFCESNLSDWIDLLDLTAPECGFWWYKMGKLEHQFVNIRHIEHHAAQLADRLRNSYNLEVDWVGGKS